MEQMSMQFIRCTFVPVSFLRVRIHLGVFVLVMFQGEMTPLITAAEFGMTDIVTLLLESDAQIDATDDVCLFLNLCDIHSGRVNVSVLNR